MNKQIRLLYILPDVAYVVDLVNTKPDGSFNIQSFLQLNGQFLTEDGFIIKNLDKLFQRIDKASYHLILPDFLFTNTIVNVSETEDDKIAAYLKNSLLPSLGIDTRHYSLDTTILTTIKNNTKVQLSAIEKTLLIPISVLLDKHQVELSAVSPFTWTIKSAISLEPSISLVQLGGYVYSGLHYIGVDQTNMAQLDELEVLAETIKTLKGAEPNIQTIYLASNLLIEERLKQVLSTTLPIQQLVSSRNDKEAKIPEYLRFSLETGARTINIDDYPVPKFRLPPVSESEKLAIFDQLKTEAGHPAEKSTKKTKSSSAQVTTTTVTTKSPKKLNLNETTTQTSPSKPTHLQTQSPPSKSTLAIRSVEQTKSNQPKTINTLAKDVDLSQFAASSQSVSTNQLDKGGKKMMKMIFITLAVFFATVAVGAGVGFGLLTLTNKNNDQAQSQSAEIVTPSPTPTATPSPTEAELQPVSILVANATTKAGYAGTTKEKILKANQDAEKNVLKEVVAANAKGSYQTPTKKNTQLLLVKEKNDAIKAALEKATGFKLEYADGIETEDPNGKYDAVIVLVQ